MSFQGDKFCSMASSFQVISLEPALQLAPVRSLGHKGAFVDDQIAPIVRCDKKLAVGPRQHFDDRATNDLEAIPNEIGCYSDLNSVALLVCHLSILQVVEWCMKKPAKCGLVNFASFLVYCGNSSAMVAAKPPFTMTFIGLIERGQGNGIFRRGSVQFVGFLLGHFSYSSLVGSFMHQGLKKPLVRGAVCTFDKGAFLGVAFQVATGIAGERIGSE